MGGYMPVGRYKVVYVDEHTEECKSNFLGLVEVERRWPDGDKTPYISATAFAVYHYLGCPGEDFDKWLATVYNIEVADEDEATDADTEVPTEPAAGAA
jgi:hypothetical protein